MRRPARVLAAALLALLCLPLAARAGAGRIAIEVQVIRASATGKQIDPELKALAQQLTKLFAQYSSYRLLKTATLDLAYGASGTVDIPEGKALTVTPKALTKGKLEVALKMDEPEFSTDVRLKPGARLLVGGPKLEGGVLILAVTARTAD